MTIEKGAAWGAPVRLRGDEPIARSDAEAMALVAPALDRGERPPTILLRGGDLYRMLGGRPADDPQAFPVDVLEIEADGRHLRAIGHVIAHRPGWTGRFVVAMNGAFAGERNLGPRAHPNDGLVDVTDGALPLRQRIEAHRRALTGSHLPHPSLATRRVAEATFELPGATPLWVDGVRCGSCRHLSVTVLADAATVAI